MLGRAGTALVTLFVCLGMAVTPTSALAAKGKKAKSKAKPKVEMVKPIEPSAAISSMAGWAVRTGDNQDMPFAIIDKPNAVVFVFKGDGEFVGATPALLGLAFGDNSTPGIGDRELSDIAPEDRTTPAGRFIGGYGPALGKTEDVLWVDYGTAISLHAVVTSKPDEKRLERLKSETIDDNRITFGCINVSKKFYRDVVKPTFTGTRGLFYVLPEQQSVAEVFPRYAMDTMMAKSGPSATAALSRDEPISPELAEQHHPSGWW